jgi:polygalacturonase
VSFGAVSGGAVDCSTAFATAISTCHDEGGGRVVVPAGQFFTGPIHLKSNVELHVARDAEIVFSDQFEDYLPVVLVRVGGIELYNYSPLIYARDCINIAVTGAGKLNGNASAWWDWKDRETRRGFEMGAKAVPVEDRVFGTPEAGIRPSFLSFVNCVNVLLADFTIGSGPNWTIHPIYCQNMTIRGVNVVTDGPNNDGIDPDSCRDVLIEHCTFDTGDDCVVLKSGYNQDGWRVGRPTENVVMRNCTSKRGHGGLVIGSEMSGGVRNVFIENCSFEGTDRIIRIKSRADRGGIVENIFARNLIADNLQQDVIILTMDYGSDTRAFVNNAKPPIFRSMAFEKITASGAPIAIVIQGMPDSPIRDLRVADMTICSKQGVVAKNVEKLFFRNVQITRADGPVFAFENANGVAIKESNATNGTDVFLQLNDQKSRHIVIDSCDLSAAMTPVKEGNATESNAVTIR